MPGFKKRKKKKKKKKKTRENHKQKRNIIGKDDISEAVHVHMFSEEKTRKEKKNRKGNIIDQERFTSTASGTSAASAKELISNLS